MATITSQNYRNIRQAKAALKKFHKHIQKQMKAMGYPQDNVMVEDYRYYNIHDFNLNATILRHPQQLMMVKNPPPPYYIEINIPTTSAVYLSEDLQKLADSI